MLQYTDVGSPDSLMLLVHHDDEAREFAYDRKAAIGRLDKGLDEARLRNWRLVSMKKEFKKIFR